MEALNDTPKDQSIEASIIVSQALNAELMAHLDGDSESLALARRATSQAMSAELLGNLPE